MNRSAREWLVVGGIVLVVTMVLGSFGFIGPGATGDVHGKYLLGRLFIVGVFALLALGLSLEMGYAGLLNLGHVAFMAIGGYTMAIFSTSLTRADKWGDLRPVLEGASAWGIATCVLAALLVALLVYVPLLLSLQRFAGRRRWPFFAAGLAGLAAAAWAFARMFPLEENGATNMIVLLGLLLGMALAAIAGGLLGLTGLRLREDYLAIVTLGAAESLRLVLANEEWLTQGTQGIQSVPNPIFAWETRTPWIDALSKTWNVLPFYLAIAIVAVLAVALVFLVVETISRAPWGRVLKAIREDEDVASALGKNVLLYKLQALMVGSAIAALAGALYVWNSSQVVPEDFLSLVTFYSLAILILGGIGNHKGAIVGAFILFGVIELGSNLTFLQRYGIQFAGPLQNIFVGLVLILVVMLRPQGAIGSKEEMVLGK